jgi:hypothetical protein
VTTTWSPAFRPLVIWISPLLVMPVVTARVDLAPFTETVTEGVPFDRVIAAAGTASASGIAWYVMTADALAPAWKPVGVPSTVTTTGKVATPELDDAIAPTDVTVPVADAAVAAGVGVDPDEPSAAAFPFAFVASFAFVCPPKPVKPPAPPPPPPPNRPKPPAPELVDVLELLVGVTVADCPTFTLPTVVVSTLRFTT